MLTLILIIGGLCLFSLAVILYLAHITPVMDFDDDD
jgi:hypothetical protein